MATSVIYVTRTELSLGNLDLKSAVTSVANPPVGYLVTDPEKVIDTGGISWRHMRATSPYVHGATPINSTMDMVDLALDVIVLAQDHATLKTLFDALVKAFSQTTYQLHLELDGSTYAWKCERADLSAAMNRRAIHGKSLVVGLSIPRQPIAVLGPI